MEEEIKTMVPPIGLAKKIVCLLEKDLGMKNMSDLYD